jgi:spore germination cell wall hydrolase CwlJ-like protein
LIGLTCLALAVYFEARSEPVKGQLAVAQVIINRVESGKFPDTVCAVVHDGTTRGGHTCQFSFMCDGKPETITDDAAYDLALLVASVALSPGYHDPSRGALYYHAVDVHPDWAGKMKESIEIGRHIFYKEP